jgi:hypothetical protein
MEDLNATGHVLAVGKMSQPPTTAQCETDFGIACYQAFQLQRAYNLAPLFAKGIEGQGQTIVIVDAFGSPSIASDLQTFDAQMGLPNPPSFKVITPAGPITTNPKNCTSPSRRRHQPELRRQRADLHQPWPDLLAALGKPQRGAARGHRAGGER